MSTRMIRIFNSTAANGRPLQREPLHHDLVSFNDLESYHCRAIVAEHLPFDGDRKIYYSLDDAKKGREEAPCKK